MTDGEKTAACLLYLFAFLMYDEARDGPWYRWTTYRSWRLPESFESTVWWALRFEHDEPSSSAECWLEYVQFKIDQRSGKPGWTVRT